VVLATDGIWEYLSNTEVANIIYPYLLTDRPKSIEDAAKSLVQQAQNKWRENRSGGVGAIDDTTCVILFLH